MTQVKTILELYEQTGSYRGTAREAGVSHNTVKRYVIRAQAAREGKIDAIVPEHREIIQPCRVVTDEIRGKIHHILEENQYKKKKQRCNAKLIWQYLVRSGYTLSYSTVKREVAKWQETNGHREVFIAQQTMEGQRAEFDFGMTWLTFDTSPAQVPMASFVLNNSLYRYSILTHRETLMDIIDAHIRFFNEIGGVPETIFYDNPKTIMLNPGTKEWNPAFLAFAAHYGFTPHSCSIRSPHEKGTTEESVKYVRQSVFAERSVFTDMHEANQFLREKLDDINDHPVYQRKLTPRDGLVEERTHLKPLPTLEYSNYSIKKARISKYSIATFETNKYSVPEQYPGTTVTLKIFTDRIDMIDHDMVVATHPRLYGRDEYSLDICHYLQTFKCKPGSIANSRVFKQLNETIQRLYHDFYVDKPRDFLPLLSLLKEYSAGSVVKAIKLLETHGMIPTHDTIRCILTQQPFQAVEPIRIVGFDIKVDQPDLTAFNRLMGV